MISFQLHFLENDDVSTIHIADGLLRLNLRNNHRDKPLSRVAATCRTLSVLCKFAFIALASWSIFVLILMCYYIATTKFDNEILPLAYAVPSLYALYSANSCLLPVILSRMLGDISEDRTPFTFQNANRLLFLALVLLLYSVLEALLASVDSHFVFIAGNASIEIGGFMRDFASNSGTTLNLFPLLMSAMFFALSYVFKYGVLLQQESDETL